MPRFRAVQHSSREMRRDREFYRQQPPLVVFICSNGQKLFYKKANTNVSLSASVQGFRGKGTIFF